MLQSILILSIMVIVLLLTAPQDTGAYIGPGTGISAIGTVLAFIAGIILAIIGFLWYPIKRWMAKIKKKQKGTSS